jgi:hypothetical protein
MKLNKLQGVIDSVTSSWTPSRGTLRTIHSFFQIPEIPVKISGSQPHVGPERSLRSGVLEAKANGGE